MVKSAWNDNFLYFCFECEASFTNVTMTKFNDLIFQESEVAEIFINDNLDLRTYLEFEVNPLNAILHYNIHNDGQGKIITFARTSQTICSAVKRQSPDGPWSAEMAIPFSEFITTPNSPPKTGDKWPLNLFRMNKQPDGSVEYSAWSPTGRNWFHHPEYFGELIFSDEFIRIPLL